MPLKSNSGGKIILITKFQYEQKYIKERDKIIPLK